MNEGFEKPDMRVLIDLSFEAQKKTEVTKDGKRHERIARIAYVPQRQMHPSATVVEAHRGGTSASSRTRNQILGLLQDRHLPPETARPVGVGVISPDFIFRETWWEMREPFLSGCMANSRLIHIHVFIGRPTAIYVPAVPSSSASTASDV